MSTATGLPSTHALEKENGKEKEKVSRKIIEKRPKNATRRSIEGPELSPTVLVLKFFSKNSKTVVYYTYTYRGCAIGAAKLQHRSRAPGAFFCGDHGRHRKALKNATTGGKCVKTSGFSARLFTKGGAAKIAFFLRKLGEKSVNKVW